MYTIPLWGGSIALGFSYSYVLVSAGDASGNEWRTTDGALLHLNTVEQYDRWDSKASGSFQSRLIEAEATIRHEWHRITQHDKTMSLDDAIELT